MKKQFFVSLAVVVLALASQACATLGGYGSLPMVVASNAALPYQILAASQIGQPGWVYHGQSSAYAPTGYQWVCKPVSFMHKLEDAGLAALAGGSFFGWRGAGGGAGVGGFIAQHEKDCYLARAYPIQQSAATQPLSPFLVRVMNPTQAPAVLFDGNQQVGMVPSGEYVDVPPATSGYRAELSGIDTAGRPTEIPADIVQPDPQQRVLEIRVAPPP